jgi:hypothetical protein
MAVGIFTFVVAYTATTSTTWFARLWNVPRLRRTLYITYGVRLTMSLGYSLCIFPDFLLAALSCFIVGTTESPSSRVSFQRTLAATVIYGILVHVVMSVFAVLIYGILRDVRGFRSRAEARRGFEVLTTQRPVTIPPPPARSVRGRRRPPENPPTG